MAKPTPQELSQLVRTQAGRQAVWTTRNGRWAVVPAEMVPGLAKGHEVDLGPSLGFGREDDPTAETDMPTQVGERQPTLEHRVSDLAPAPHPSDTLMRRIALALFVLSMILLLLTLGIWIGSATRTQVAETAPSVAPVPTAALVAEQTPPDVPPSPVDEAPQAPVATPATPTPATPTPATPRPTPTPRPATPRPTPRATPKPTPRPTPNDATTAPGLTRTGWSMVERNPASAAEYFRRALRIKGGDGEATYGLGYALLKLGDSSGATRYLCQASLISSPSTRREVSGLIKTNGITCP